MIGLADPVIVVSGPPQSGGVRRMGVCGVRSVPVPLLLLLNVDSIAA
jgi:hypothetical protein